MVDVLGDVRMFRGRIRVFRHRHFVDPILRSPQMLLLPLADVAGRNQRSTRRLSQTHLPYLSQVSAGEHREFFISTFSVLTIICFWQKSRALWVILMLLSVSSKVSLWKRDTDFETLSSMAKLVLSVKMIDDFLTVQLVIWSIQSPP